MNGCRVALAARLAALVFRWSKQLTKVACQLAQGESIDLPVLPCTEIFCVPDSIRDAAAPIGACDVCDSKRVSVFRPHGGKTPVTASCAEWARLESLQACDDEAVRTPL